MKKLLEAINKSILQELNNNIQLLSDIGSNDGNSQFNITSKSVNNNIESSHIVFKYEFINTIDSMLNFNDTTEKIRRVMNDPKNFNIFKGLVKETDAEHLKKLINIGKKLLGDDGNFNWIDTSNINDMYGLFYNDSTFNGHIELWNVSNVKNMRCMFSGAESFNQPIGDWDVSNVKDMECMFNGAKSFKQDLSKWKLKSDCKTYRMFNSSCPIKKVYKPEGIE